MPKTAENFRLLCTGEAGPSTYCIPLHFTSALVTRAVRGKSLTIGLDDRLGGNSAPPESTYGAWFEDEPAAGRLNVPGCLHMNTLGLPCRNASSFVIELSPNASVIPVFGVVTAGLEVARRIADSKPLQHARVVDCGQIH
jgi:cyclophilin family peptidyl-prolyl cis-trans isomerase